MIFSQRFSDDNLDEAMIGGARAAFSEVIADNEAGKLPVLNLPQEAYRIEELQPIADYFRENFKTVVVLGTGGSSLGGQALSALLQDPFGFQLSGPKIVFMDNIDPDTFERFFSTVDFKTTGFIVISKSGNTAETICQLLTILNVWEDREPRRNPYDYFLVITEPKDSKLTEIAKSYRFPMLSHDANIGGRFAALSLVGLLPAMIAGLDPYKILEGAQAVLNQKHDGTYIYGSAWTMAQYGGQCKTSVMMPYCDRLQLLSKWYCQLWAESLGKEGKGITPVAASGTVDQHSQLQLYLDGPKDKMFTILTTEYKGHGDTIMKNGGELTGHSMGDLIAAEQEATIETLHRKGCPIRVLNIPKVNEQAIGGLMMHFVLETMITAKMMNVNAFDQPAVEEGKILAMQYLKQEQAA